MTELETQCIGEGASEPKFRRSVLRDAWDAMIYNLVVFLISTALLIVILEVAKFGIPRIETIKADRIDLFLVLALAAYVFAISMLACAALSLLVYSVHSSVMTGATGWSAFRAERRSDICRYVIRFTVTAAVPFSMSSLLFISMLFGGLALGIAGHPAGLILATCIWTAILIATIVLANLTSSFPISVFYEGQSSWRRAWARGKIMFAYVAGRNLLLVPLTLFLWIAFGWIVGAMILGDPVSVNGMVSSNAIWWTSFSASCWCVVQAIIVSRAFLIGEARLSSSE